ncbi:MAG: prolipoprotein diacylglyceryl transferase [Deltaproteobacteria bacterium]|nr:MAG: prolipoprotein diacylglyceryl transferase [Deltaproteobacteria bacterium]
MLPVLYDLVLTPKGALALSLLVALVLAGTAAWRAKKDNEALQAEGRDVDPKRPLKTFAFWALIVAGAAFLLLPPLDSDQTVELPLHTYGLMIALGFLSAIVVTTREAVRSGRSPVYVPDAAVIHWWKKVNETSKDPPPAERKKILTPDYRAHVARQHVLDLAFWVLLAGLAGARILFIIVNLDQYFGDNFMGTLALGKFHMPFPRILIVWQGGLVFYGGLIGAAVGVFYYLWRNKLPLWPWTDMIIPAVPLGHFFGRLGCFSAGCCWGKACPSDSLFATYFPEGSLAFAQTDPSTHIHHLGQLTTQAVYPTQLFESVATLGIFFLLVYIRRNKRFHGMVLVSYAIVYPLFRTINETVRGDWGRGMLLRWPAGDPVLLSTSQLISFLVACAGIALLVWRIKRARAEAGDREPGPRSGAVAA